MGAWKTRPSFPLHLGTISRPPLFCDGPAGGVDSCVVAGPQRQPARVLSAAKASWQYQIRLSNIFLTAGCVYLHRSCCYQVDASDADMAYLYSASAPRRPRSSSGRTHPRTILAGNLVRLSFPAHSILGRGFLSSREKSARSEASGLV